MKEYSRSLCILSVAVSTRGCAFVVIEGSKLLMSGAKSAKGEGDKKKNDKVLTKVKTLIRQWRPRILTIEDVSTGRSQRRSRIKKLIPQIAALAQRHGLRVAPLSRHRVKQVFFPGGHDVRKTKYDVAKRLAESFPEELGDRLPPKRRAWENEKSAMDLFDTVAFAVAFLLANDIRGETADGSKGRD